MTEDVQARLLQHAASRPGAPFLAVPGRPTMHWGALACHVARVRERFTAWGLARGDIVAVSTADRTMAATLFACAPVSSTVTMIPGGPTEDACRVLLTRMSARAVVVPAGAFGALGAAARALGLPTIVASPCEDAGAFELSCDAPSPVPTPRRPIHPPGWAYVGITSGTTDRPKLVPYSHRAIVRISDALGAVLRIVRDDVSALVTPIHLANGQRTAFLLPVMHGGSVICLPEGGVESLVAALRGGRITFLSATFTILRALLERADRDSSLRSPALRFLRVASGTLDPDEIRRLEDRFAVPVVTGLATTETGVITHQRLPPEPRTVGSAGAPLLAEIRLLGDDGEVPPRGAAGEVLVRGPQVFDGYLDDAALDAGSRLDGWFRTGDLARFDEAGDLYVVGRVKEVINRGGEKIAPLEIDAALRAIPGVVDAAAFGIPHPTLGEEIVAAVVRGEGATVTEHEVLDAVRVRLGARRAPRRLWFVDALPRNRADKVLRTSLRVRFASAASVGSAASPDDPPPSPFAAALMALWCSVLGVPRVPSGATFHSLGGDAGSAEDLVARIHAAFGVQVPAPTPGHGDETLDAMARSIERALGATPRADAPRGTAGARSK